MGFRRTALACVSIIALIPVAPPVAEAEAPSVPTQEFAIPNDIFEPVNRAMFDFNVFVVGYVVNPAASILSYVTPGPVQRVATNLYENINEPEFVFTNLLAGYPKDAAVSVGRFAINTTIGLAGIVDVATPMGLVRRSTEVSEAMCKAGVPPGPYIVLPLIGPTNVFSGGLLGATLAAEWYALGLVSATLAAADALLDLVVAMASLRHTRDIPDEHRTDTYAVQQKEFWDYVKAGCQPTEHGAMTAAVSPTR
jgi:phospholipid-binding lipoprotein MlaA